MGDAREEAIDWLLDSIQWCVYADAKRDDVANVVDRMAEGTCWDTDVFAIVRVPRGCEANAQGVIDAKFYPRARSSEDKSNG